MNTHFVIADAEGVVLQQTRTTLGWEEVLAAWVLPPGQALVRTEGPLDGPPDHFRVVAGEVVARAVMMPSVSATSIAADGEAACVIAGLPDPCSVVVVGAVSAGPVEVTGGELVLTSTVSGAIHVLVRDDPDHAPWEVSIDAA